MAWTAIPADYATGHLVTASEWNTFVFDNPAFLKGQDGDVAFEDDIVGDAGTEKVGLSTKPWVEGHYSKLFASPRAALHKFIRECVIEWEENTLTDYQLETTMGGGGLMSMGGFGQAVLKVDNNGAGSVFTRQQVEQDNALVSSFNAARSPYYRQEFAIDRNVADTGAFIGLRQTPGAAPPIYTEENFFGLVWTGAIWQFQAADGTNVDASGTQTINVDTRYVVEFLLISATSVECYLNGVLVDTLTVIPTGALNWSVLLESDGGGGATDTHLTLGKVILQEDLA